MLGSIITGIATVNQAGAIGAAGAIVMAGYRLNPKQDYTAYSARPATSCFYFNNDLRSNEFQHEYIVNSKWNRSLGNTYRFRGSGLFIVSLIWSCVRLYKIEGTLNDVMLGNSKDNLTGFYNIARSCCSYSCIQRHLGVKN